MNTRDASALAPPLRPPALLDWIVAIVVSIYLAAVLAVLRATGRYRPPASLAALVRERFRGVRRGTLTDFSHQEGHCFLVRVPRSLISDAEGRSRLRIYEDGAPLPRPHTWHEEIRRLGEGRYSHWSARVFLSASDNSDPRTNGRTYNYDA
jgi:hypothetical protein